MRIIVVGAAGRLGVAMVAAAARRGHDTRALERAELDITDEAATRRVVGDACGAGTGTGSTSTRSGHDADAVVVNCAAYNAVDAAEDDAGPAYRVNARAVWNLAAAARDAGARLVHVSTDYVFDGLAGRPYVETDAEAPLGAYGLSKLAGERLALWALGPERALIARTAVVFGQRSGRSASSAPSFAETVLAYAKDPAAELRATNDLVVSPSYAPDVAERLCELVERGAAGVWHVANAGATTRWEFARYVLDHTGQADRPLKAVTQAEFGAKARRPANSSLASARDATLGLGPLPPWQHGLDRFLGELGVRR